MATLVKSDEFSDSNEIANRGDRRPKRGRAGARQPPRARRVRKHRMSDAASIDNRRQRLLMSDRPPRQCPAAGLSMGGPPEIAKMAAQAQEIAWRANVRLTLCASGQ